MKRKDRLNQIHGAAEMLEDRIAPATLPLLDLSGGPVIGTFTDADGDTVTVRIEGNAGKVEFQDAGGNSVDDGEDIASVIITGSSADFALTYSFDAEGGGAGIVNMGNITANKIVRGIFSVPLTGATGTFALGSFVGPGFSAGGGLSVDDVIGNADGLGIQVNGLDAGRSINIRNNIIGDLIIQGGLGGSIVVGGEVNAASAWQINKTVAPTAQIAVGSSFNGTFEARGVFAGDVQIEGFASGAWTFDKNVLKTAQLTASGWENVQASRNWAGQLFAVTSDVTMSVGGQILGSSVFSGEGQLQLIVEGSVQAGANFGFTSDITATVGGNLAGNWTGSQSVTLTVSGNVSGAVISSGSDMTMTVSKSILKSEIHSDSNLVLDVSGSVNSAYLTAPDAIIADISGSVANSTLEGSEATMTLTVGGNLTGSRVVNGSENVTLNVTGNVVGSTVASLESSVQLTIGGSMIDAHVVAARDVFGTITRDAVRSSFESNDANANDAGDDLTLSFGGDFNASQATGDGGVTLAVAGRVTNSSLVSTNGNVGLSSGKDMSGSQVDAALDATVGVSGRLIGSNIGGDEGTRTLVEVDLDVINSTINGFAQNTTLSVGRNLISSSVYADAIAQVTVTGSISNSQMAAANDITASATGNVTRSTIASSQSNATVTVGGNFLASTVACDEDMFLSVIGNMSGVVNSFDSDITLTVGGTMSGKAISAGDLIGDIGDLTGSVAAQSLDLIVRGDVATGARIDAGEVDDFNADTVGFRVDGNFGGLLNVIDFDSDVVGGSTLVAGNVSKSARFNIAGLLGDTADESFTFGGDFLGVLNIGGDIDVNLVFNGNVNQVIIGGLVGTTAAMNTIDIAGKLKFLSSGSLFDETTPGEAGSFVNGAGTTTATLSADGGFIKVIPAV